MQWTEIILNKIRHINYSKQHVIINNKTQRDVLKESGDNLMIISQYAAMPYGGVSIFTLIIYGTWLPSSPWGLQPSDEYFI